MNILNLNQLGTLGQAFGIVPSPDEYHKSKDGIENCISKSSLADFAKNPHKWRYAQVNGIKKVSAGFRFGSLVDCLTLTPEHEGKLYMADEKKPRVNKDGSISKTKQDEGQAALWSAFEARGGTVISPDMRAEGCKARDLTNAYMEQEHGLILGQTFDSQVAMYKVLNVEYAPGKSVPIVLTGMIDILPTDESLPIIDLKTTSTPVEDKGLIDRDIVKYRYGWQAAIYADLYEAIFGVRRKFMFIFAESAAPYCIAEIRMDFEALDFYRAQYWAALKLYAECVATGNWPGAVMVARHFEVPMWERKTVA